MKKRRVLFCNFCLGYRSGTETFLEDLIRSLQAKGWECGVYTPRAGPFIDGFRQANIPVWHQLEEITMEPDILHCQHTLESLALSTRFPDVPALFMVHDARSKYDTVPAVARWSALVAVDEVCRERIVRETGLRPDQVDVAHNSVDTTRFLPRAPLPETPSKALIFTSYSVNDGHVRAARELCQRLGIALDELGAAAGQVEVAPEHCLPKYDLVFCKGRCAYEAMAVGSAVILIGAEGVGEMVTPENFTDFKKRNFGYSLLRPGMDQDFLEEQVKRYSPASTRQIQEMVRNTCSLNSMAESFIRLYEELPARPRISPELRNDFPMSTMVASVTLLLQEQAALSTRHEQSMIEYKRTVDLLHQQSMVDHQRTIGLLEQEVFKLRDRVEHYRASVNKYKIKAGSLRQKLLQTKEKKRSFWKNLTRLFRREKSENRA